MVFMVASKKVIEMANVAAQAIADKLGVDIVAIDMTDQMVLSEVFLIATGANNPQIDAIVDNVLEKLSAIGEKPLRKEGTGEWVLLDYSDLVVHIQSRELRNYYMLERLWNDCPRIPLKVSEVR
jgi:ribosome-associated protein